MFGLASGIYQSYFAPPKLSILIIGLDGSGKTALFERVKVTDARSRLDVNTAAGPSSLPASFAKGGAMAGVGVTNNMYSDFPEHGHKQQQPQQGGKHSNAGKPARLPPPLPPHQALKSSQWAEKVMQDGISSSVSETEEESSITSGLVNPLHVVPPPPLVSSGNSDVSTSSTSDGGQSELKANRKKPPLPPRHNNSTTTKNPSTSSLLETPIRKSSFIQLLRCPSPGRYSDAKLGEEDDEEYHDNNPAATSPSPVKDLLEPWSTEYLRDYYINYQEDEEFDCRQRVAGGNVKKMFPMNKIRPTLGQNLAKLDLCGCKCSLFDLSGAEKMRPLWDRYYRDTDAIIYVVNAAERSFTKLFQSSREFEKMCQNEALQRRIRSGLPVLIFANQLDVAYEEYDASMVRANNERNGRTISWNADEEDDFVGGTQQVAVNGDEDGTRGVTRRVVDFHDLAALFGFKQNSSSADGNMQNIGKIVMAQRGNVFLFGGSAKTGEGVRAAMEYLVAHAKSYHLGRQARK